MLLNLTNHPFDHWPDTQRAAALEAFSTVEDLGFPAIDPEAAEEQVRELALEYLKRIQARNPSAVHIQGEHTFTCTLVWLLQQAGIPCLASTTERIVRQDDNGNSVRQFRFVRFRRYPEIA